MKYFRWSTFFTNLLSSFLLNIVAIVLLGIGIWKREFLYAGLAVLAVDVILAFVKAVVMAKTFENTDNPDMIDFRDRIFGEGKDDDGTRGMESEADFDLEDTPEVTAIKHELGERPTIDEVIDVFRKHCSSLAPNDLLLFETGVYDFLIGEGRRYYFELTRQTEKSMELMQLKISIVFEVTPGNRFLRIVKWFGPTESDFFEFVRSTKQYKYATTHPYLKIRVQEYPTD